MVVAASSGSGRQSSRMDSHALVSCAVSLSLFCSIVLSSCLVLCSGLERYWQSAFAWFFRPYMIGHSHVWTLEPVELPPISANWPWHHVSFTAKVHFQCPVSLDRLFTFLLLVFIVLNDAILFLSRKGIQAGRPRRAWSSSGSECAAKGTRPSARCSSSRTVSNATDAVSRLSPRR